MEVQLKEERHELNWFTTGFNGELLYRVMKLWVPEEDILEQMN
jgi:hypothetical protein